MRKIGLLLLALGAAGFLLLQPPAGRWESVGVAVTGVVLLLIPSRER